MTTSENKCCEKCEYLEFGDLGQSFIACGNSSCPCHVEKNNAAETMKEKLKQGAKMFARDFTGVMKELAEEESVDKHPIDLGPNSTCNKCFERYCACPERQTDGSWAEKNGTEWREARQNLLALLQKYPNAALDVIDSAYLAGLEASDYQKGAVDGQKLGKAQGFQAGKKARDAEAKINYDAGKQAGIYAAIAEAEGKIAELIKYREEPYTGTENAAYNSGLSSGIQAFTDLITRLKALLPDKK